MLRLSQAKLNQIKYVNMDNFYECQNFGAFYLCNGNDLTYISHEDDNYIISCLINGNKIVAIRELE